MHLSLPHRYRVALLVVAMLCLLAARQAAWAAPWTAPLNQTVPTRTKVYTPTQAPPAATATSQPTVAPTQPPPTVAPTKPPATSALATSAPATSAPAAGTATPESKATLAPPNLPTTGGPGDVLWLTLGALFAASILVRGALALRARRAPRGG